MRTRAVVVVLVVVVVVAAAVAVALLVTVAREREPVPPAGAAPASARPSSEQLRAAVGAAGMRRHLDTLQRIAEANGGHRAAGTSGYDASLAYVERELRAAGYATRTDRFEVPVSAERRPPVLQILTAPLPLRAGFDYRLLAFSAGGDVRARVAGVDLEPPGGAATSGCEPGDFAGFRAGDAALLKRGGCPFRVKAERAQQAGAAAVLIFDDPRPAGVEAFEGTLGGPGVRVPVLALRNQVGTRLAGGRNRVRVAAATVSEARATASLLAERPGTDGDRVVMLGAHLDSVSGGPGINDNGSGTAAVLEIARALARRSPRATVRFAWWGGEELGLLGSRHYVAQRTRAELDRIAVYLNLDMIGSPNFARLVYAGGPPGSRAVEQTLNDHFRSVGLASGPVDLSGRSDHGPFAARGVPVGGLFSGAEEIKGAGEPGGGAGPGRPYDACYHRACDRLDNVNPTALEQLGDAAAHAVATFADGTQAIDRERRRP
jgi:Zn-dependent M28 family amino/carboxypeptidase